MSSPAFVREFKHSAGRLGFHSGFTVKGQIVEAFVTEKVGVGKQNELANAPFWIIEGFLWDYELDESLAPSLHYYLSNRDGKDMNERWELYTQAFDQNEGLELMNAYTRTRRHALETEADLPIEEKKSA